MTSPTSPTPVHDEARGHHDRHAATLTLQEHRQREDLAAELARPHPNRLRLLLEGLADPAAPGGPNRAGAWVLTILNAVVHPDAHDGEPLRNEVAVLGAELASAAATLSAWLLMGAVAQDLLPEGAVAGALGEQEHERARLRALAVDISALADDGALHGALARQLLRYLPEDVLAEAAFEAAATGRERPAWIEDVTSPALGGEPIEAPDERARAAEILAEMRAQSPAQPEPAPEPGDGFYAQRAADAAVDPEPVAEPEARPWPAELVEHDPSQAPTEVIEPPDRTEELR